MLRDKLLQLSSGLALTDAQATATDVAPIQAVRDLGAGEPLAVVCRVSTVLTDTHAVAGILGSHDDADFGSTTTVLTLNSIPGGSAAGTTIVTPIPPGLTYTAGHKWLRVELTPADSITGAVEVWIQPLAGLGGQTDKKLYTAN